MENSCFPRYKKNFHLFENSPSSMHSLNNLSSMDIFFLLAISTNLFNWISSFCIWKKKMTKLFARIWINNHDNGKENKRYYYAYDTRFFQSARDETTVIRQVFFYIFLRYIFLLQKFLYLYEILWLIKKIRIIRNNIFLYIRIT